MKQTVENQKATLEARDNDIAKLKHQVAETRKEMTDGISLIRRRAASTTHNTIQQQEYSNGSKSSSTLLPKRSNSESTTTLQRYNSLKEGSIKTKTKSTNGVTEEEGEAGGEGEEEPFLILNQEEFSEHASSITHAKFSSQEGDLIASCDLDNIVRIWSYKGQSFNPLKIKNASSNILSLEWDARSDRFVSPSKDDL